MLRPSGAGSGSASSDTASPASSATTSGLRASCHKVAFSAGSQLPLPPSPACCTLVSSKISNSGNITTFSTTTFSASDVVAADGSASSRMG
jgi:hypothetical protein